MLWKEDGLSQRELSARVGMMEPTTVIALRSMEKSGLIRRVRSTDDKRISHVRPTPKAQRLRNEMLALARGITEEAEEGVTSRRPRSVPAGDCADDGESGSNQDVIDHFLGGI